MFFVRKAVTADVPQIYNLLKDYAAKGLMLPRSLSDLYEVIRAFHIASPVDRPEVAAGVCALHVVWADLGEIRSLGVAPEYKGAGLGEKLVSACAAEAVGLGLTKLFVLTYIPEYFKKLEFTGIEKSALPQKIWADCFKCVNFPDCGEEALEKYL
ncbi:MAG: N-acetyltransferase [Pseudomonadota bacterium]